MEERGERGTHVVEADFDPSREERVKVGRERCVALVLARQLAREGRSGRGAHVVRPQMLVVLYEEGLAKEVPYMSNHDQEQVRVVRCQPGERARASLDGRQAAPCRPDARSSVPLVLAVAKLGVA